MSKTYDEIKQMKVDATAYDPTVFDSTRSVLEQLEIIKEYISEFPTGFRVWEVPRSSWMEYVRISDLTPVGPAIEGRTPQVGDLGIFLNGEVYEIIGFYQDAVEFKATYLVNLKGPKGDSIKGEKGDGMPSNMSQNANKTIVVDGSVVNGNWNATFISQQGGKQRPICTQYTNHTGAKAEMVATSNSAKFKFVNGSTDPQSYVEIFEDKINFSKPITVQGNPVGGGGEYYICAPLVDGADTYASDSCFILLPPESSCSKIELVDVVYLQQPRNSSPYSVKIDLNWVLYDKNGGPTTEYGDIPYQQGDLDGSGNFHDSPVYFYYSSSYGSFGGYASPETDGYQSVRTSCFRFKITV